MLSPSGKRVCYTVAPFLDERGRSSGRAAGSLPRVYGGIARGDGNRHGAEQHRAGSEGMARKNHRVRQSGGPDARRRYIKGADMVADLEARVEPTTRGDPTTVRWTCKSVRRWPRRCTAGNQVEAVTWCRIDQCAGYSLPRQPQDQGGRQAHQRRDRNSPPLHQHEVARGVADSSQVISVDTKKKELVRRFPQQWPRVIARKSHRRGPGARLLDKEPAGR